MTGDSTVDVCVHGLGYIGLPTAAVLAHSGFEVVGYDISEAVVDRLERRDLSDEEPDLRAFIDEALDGSLTPRDEPVAASYHVICVPTPLKEGTMEADLSAVRAAARSVAALLREDDTVVLESTVPPGTTEGVVAPELERSGLDVGTDVRLAYSPETVLPGNILAELRANDRIVGGVDSGSVESAVALYESFVEGDIHTTVGPTTAELVKLLQNTFRDTNIALANEVAKVAHDYGVDSREAITLANRHPRVNLHQPGLGVGGHCLPIDPWFLGQNSDSLDLIARARAVNDGMVDYVVELLVDRLGSLDGRRIAVLGVAYKGNVDDVRGSPGLRFARRVQSIENGREDDPRSVEVTLHDDHVTDGTLDLVPLSDALSGADAVVLATDHDEYTDLDPTRVGELVDRRLIVDTKAMLDVDEWQRAGFTVCRI